MTTTSASKCQKICLNDNEFGPEWSLGENRCSQRMPKRQGAASEAALLIPSPPPWQACNHWLPETSELVMSLKADRNVLSNVSSASWWYLQTESIAGDYYFFFTLVVKIPRVKSSKKLKSKAGVAIGIWIVLGLMGNEIVSKQNGVEALCGDCNTLEETGRCLWIPRDLADSAAQILEEGNRRVDLLALL